MTHHVTARSWGADSMRAVELSEVGPALERGCVVWVDVAADTASWRELADLLGPVLGVEGGELDLRFLEPDGSPPKVKILRDGTTLVRAYTIRLGDGLRVAEMHAVAGQRFLLTVRYPEDDQGPPPVPPELRARLDSASSPILTRGGLYLLYVLLDELVDDALSLVETFDEDADALEDRVFGSASPAEGRRATRRRHEAVQRDILRLKRDLGDFRRRVLPYGEVRELVQEELRRDPEGRSDFREVAEAVLRITELIDNVRDLLTGAFEAELAQVSNETNEIMKRVTSWAAILLVPTLIAGIYGMNFRHMPELGWGMGYPGALGLMLISAGGLYIAFRRQDWL